MGFLREKIEDFRIDFQSIFLFLGQTEVVNTDRGHDSPIQIDLAPRELSFKHDEARSGAK